jgi:hypothetical protein
LKIYWDVDVLNGLALPIWTSETQVMVIRKAESQTGSLIPDHWKSGIDLISLRASNVQHTVGKLLTRVITLLQISLQSGSLHKKLCALKVTGVPVVGISRLSLGNPRTKPFGCGLRGELQSIL